ncbi:MAG: hypothetical protein OXG88_05125 [Gammaproteobacteria bacterium]|nr:hypothetical protein [Gammaproteobacteria bacterium]
MQTYANNGGNSGIFGYENGDAFIIVEFEEYLYKYSHVKPGKTHVEKMKELAQVGQGLNTYINQNVKNYEWKKKKE